MKNKEKLIRAMNNVKPTAYDHSKYLTYYELENGKNIKNCKKK